MGDNTTPGGTELVYVRALYNGVGSQDKLEPGRVALWDRDPEHPNGEIFVANEVVVRAARNSAVQQALARGVLELVDEGAYNEHVESVETRNRDRMEMMGTRDLNNRVETLAEREKALDDRERALMARENPRPAVPETPKK